MPPEELSLDPSYRPRTTPDAPALPSREPFPWDLVAQSYAILGTVGASIGLFVGTLALKGPMLAAFLDKNTAGATTRSHLFNGAMIGAAVPLAAATIMLLWRGSAFVATLRQLADLVLPLSLLFLLPSLFAWAPWHANPMPYLVQLAGFTLVLEWTLRRSLSAVPKPMVDWVAARSLSPALTRAIPLVLVCAGAIFYATYMSYYTLLNHRRLQTAGYDLGIYVNWFYNALHGHPLRSSVLFGPDGGNFIGNHAIFAMVLWLPFYAIKPGAEVFLVFQSSIVALAAIPLYLFATTQIPRWSAAAVALAYLLYAPLHGPNFYDFHELLPAIVWHFLLYWAIATKRNWLVFLVVPILYAHREDVAVGIAILGMFLTFTGIRPRMGIALTIVSIVWFYLIKFVIMPRCWHTWFADIYKELQVDGAGFGSIVQTILINPSYFFTTLFKEVKVSYFLHMFAPVALLPTRRAALMFLAIPGFFFSLMTTQYAPTISISFQYTTHWVPYIFAATVLMLRLLGEGEGGAIRRRAAIGALAVAMLSHSYVFGAIFQHNTFVGGFNRIEFTMTEAEKQRYADLKRLAAMIPESASVAATENEVPHVARRMNCFTLKDNHGDGEWVLVNTAKASLGSTKKNLDDLFSRAHYGLIEKTTDFYLFRRGHRSPEDQTAAAALGIRTGVP